MGVMKRAKNNGINGTTSHLAKPRPPRMPKRGTAPFSFRREAFTFLKSPLYPLRQRGLDNRPARVTACR